MKTSLKGTEVAGAINLVLGTGLSVLALVTGDLLTTVNGCLLVTSGILLTNLK